MKLIVPSFNRSAKLRRSLEYYDAVKDRLPCTLIVLDGSDGDHKIANLKTAEMYSWVEYREYDSNIGFLERILSYLDLCEDEEIICLGTDEDVFAPDYLTRAKRFMHENADYSGYVGRYVTFLKPVLGLNRISHFRDFVIDLDIDHDSSPRRLAVLASAVLVGCSPVFFSVRRNAQLKESIRSQLELRLESAQELLDQAVLAAQGKIRFIPDVMLLRDETNLGYEYYETRHDAESYIDNESLLDLKRGGQKYYRSGQGDWALDYVCDLYNPRAAGSEAGGKSIAVARSDGVYSAFKHYGSAPKSPAQKLVRGLAKLGVVASQIISWLIVKRCLENAIGKTAVRTVLRRHGTHARA